MSDPNALYQNQIELLKRVIQLEQRVHQLETELKLSKRKSFLSKFLVEAPAPKKIKDK